MVAVFKNNLVGVAELAYNKKAPVGGIEGAELNKLYILEWFCGIGIGYDLLRNVEEMTLSRGEKMIWLWVLNTNIRAISFYERQHFQSIGKAYFKMEVNTYDNKVMVKELRSFV